MHVIAAKAVAFKEAARPEFKSYQQQIVNNAKAMAEKFIDLGRKLVSGGTDNHLMLLSFIDDEKLNGKRVEKSLDKCNITVNKNTVPFDPAKPFVTSGIRIGTPAVTSRGMKEPEMVKIAELIDRVINNRKNETVYAEVRQDVADLCQKFPLYQGRLED
jgi:glycine hydroxymethyltransferase